MLQIREWVERAKPKDRKIIGVIPARGGSTRLPDKNMRMFAGMPLVAWSVIQAKAALTLDEIWVTSDSERILECTSALGAGGFLRQKVETDETPGWYPVVEVLKEVANPDDVAVLLFPTSPLRQIFDIDGAVKKWFASPEHEEKFLVSMVRIHEDFRWRVMNDDYAVPMPPSENDLCRFDACVQVVTTKYYEKITGDTPEDAYYIPYFIEPWQGLDINTAEQLRFAEMVFYDHILRDGLNPYAEYRKGGLKV